MTLTTMQGIQDKLGLASHAADKDVNDRLDSAIEDSFSTSDPIQLSMPHDRGELKMHRGIPSSTMWLVGGGLLAIIALIALRR